jgi:hypothetical protein
MLLQEIFSENYSVCQVGFTSRTAVLEIFACSSQAATSASRRDLLISGSNQTRQNKKHLMMLFEF